MKIKPTIKFQKNTGIIDEIYVSELNFLMIRIDNNNGTYSTWNCGQYNPEENIFTNILSKKFDSLKNND